mgnify:CR=1 FL=1
MFDLTSEEKNRLKKFNGDKSIIFALKKLFLNVCVENPASNEAIAKVKKAFHDLSVISPEETKNSIEENLV